MIKISTKGRYGTRVMLELAINYDKGALLLKEISKRQGISTGYLDQLVPYLKTAGLIRVLCGSQRGYVLAKLPKDITVRAIIEALEGKISLVDCVQVPSLCSRMADCTTRLLWQQISNSLREVLSSVTLEDLVKRDEGQNKKALIYNI